MDIRENLSNGRTSLKVGSETVKGATGKYCWKGNNLLLLVFFFVFTAFSSKLNAGPGEQIMHTLGTTTAPYGFLEYLPVDYNTDQSKKFPFILFLHGGGERGNGTTDLSKVSSQGLPKNIKNGVDYPAIIISPQSTGWGAAALDKLVEYVKSNYRVDESRIYVTGLSMGGGGTWTYSKEFYSKLAAVVPICGNVSISKAENFVNLPVWAFHNDGDPTVSVNLTYNWINGIKAAGGNPKMTIYRKDGHDAWTQTYADDAMWSWLFAQKKGSTSTNKAPVANAGSDVIIDLPTNSYTITGSGSDSDGSVVSYSWVKISGPAATLTNANQATLSVSGLTAGTYVFEITVKDDKNATSSDKMTLTVNPEPVSSIENGVGYAYYEGSWTSVPDFTGLTAKSTGKTTDFNINSKLVTTNYAFNFQAEIQIDAAGTYTFYVSSDDGSLLYIDNQKVVDNNGVHTVQEKNGSIYLTAGKHPINVRFFQSSGTGSLKVSYAGPNFYKKVIPSSVLYPVGVPAGDGGTARDLNIIKYSYYEGTWNALPNFDALTPIKTGTVNTFNLSPRNNYNNFGFKYELEWDCPESGEYTFYLNSDDGSKLYVDSNVVIDNDGLHASTEKTGKVYLTQGVHSIKLLFFEKSGGELLELSYSGPNVSKQIFNPGSSSQSINATARLNEASLSIDELANKQFNAYPNPFSNYINLSIPEDNYEQIKVRLYNMSGKLIYNNDFIKTGEEIKIDLNSTGLLEGAYILSVDSPNFSKKIQILKN